MEEATRVARQEDRQEVTKISKEYKDVSNIANCNGPSLNNTVSSL
jgi:hypothetical protein